MKHTTHETYAKADTSDAAKNDAAKYETKPVTGTGGGHVALDIRHAALDAGIRLHQGQNKTATELVASALVIEAYMAGTSSVGTSPLVLNPDGSVSPPAFNPDGSININPRPAFSKAPIAT